MRGRLGRPGSHGIAAALAALAAVALAGAGLAREYGPDGPFAKHRGGCHHRGDRLAHLEDRVASLGLDAQTLEAVQGVIDEAREAARERHQELRTARRKMRELMAAEPLDAEAVLAQGDSVSELEAEAHRAKLRTLLSVRELLTPEQWQTLHEDLRPHRRPEPDAAS